MGQAPGDSVLESEKWAWQASDWLNNQELLAFVVVVVAVSVAVAVLVVNIVVINEEIWQL